MGSIKAKLDKIAFRRPNAFIVTRKEYEELKGEFAKAMQPEGLETPLKPNRIGLCDSGLSYRNIPVLVTHEH